jgi:hypothetical protein
MKKFDDSLTTFFEQTFHLKKVKKSLANSAAELIDIIINQPLCSFAEKYCQTFKKFNLAIVLPVKVTN